jgi:hypothetical protein
MPSNHSQPHRRQFLSATVPALVLSTVEGATQQPAAPPDDKNPIMESQRMPEPRIILPTDGVQRPERPIRVAAITTVWWKYSHADDFITKFIEGYGVIGRIHNPHCRVVSIYVEQFPDRDISRGMAARYDIPMFDRVRNALTLGGNNLAVDAVLLIGEHGDYPLNDIGQKLYPRRRLFEEIVNVFRATGRSVPVFNDKHLSFSWENADWMYRQSQTLRFPMMAGSSVPVAWRRPALELRIGTRLDTAVSIGAGTIESTGLHILEILQTFTERRAGGETGVRAVQCLRGEQAWQAAQQGLWSREVLDAVLAQVPDRTGRLEEVDRDAIVYLIEYTDGLRAAGYLSPRHTTEFGVGVKVTGRREPAATWCYLPKPQRDHFSFLCNHIEKMFLTGRPSYPVERTLLTTGILAAMMQSRHENGRRIMTPHLSQLRYQPAA